MKDIDINLHIYEEMAKEITYQLDQELLATMFGFKTIEDYQEWKDIKHKLRELGL